MNAASVLILDGNAKSCEALKRAIEQAGYTALVARTRPEAFALLSNLRPPLALVDVDELGDEGFRVLQEIALGASDTVALAVSGSNTTGLVVRAIRAGAADFLVKPFPAQALVGALERALAQDQAASLKPGHRNVEVADLPDPDIELLFRTSRHMAVVEDIVRRAADTNTTILLQGESGTGKEMVANAIHRISERRDKPFLKINCASLPGELLESELFGHEKGAFTGAHRRKPGKFELASHGTFLLDEIGEMVLGLQAKLLHVLQDGSFFRLGGSELIKTDARIIAATNRDLASVMAKGAFREDLYYRLNVVTISIPPLRERREQIPFLVEHFVQKSCQQFNRAAPNISPETIRLLREYNWPGNVRELENMIKRAVVLQSESLIPEEIAARRQQPWPSRTVQGQSESPIPLPSPALSGMGLKDVAKQAAHAAEKILIKEALDQVHWNRAEAARLLKISYKAMLYKIRAAGLDNSKHQKPTV
jgi:two-component system, NtrC family, response regulator AtoC